MSKSVLQQKPVSLAYPNSKGAKAIEKLAQKLLDKTHHSQRQRKKDWLQCS